MKENRIPGDLTKDQMIERIIRVNHAGEYGAKQIYRGQMAVLKDSDCYNQLQHMAEQEDKHLEYFSDQVAKRKVRPSALLPLWHIAGYALGATTALMGKKAAMACTVAVEDAIEEHYSSQLTELDNDESELKQKINNFRQEEMEHRDIGIENGAETSPLYSLLYTSIKTGSKIAIWLAKRV